MQHRTYVELGGSHIGFAETWDQLDPNTFVYYGFTPCVEYRTLFNSTEEQFNITVDPFKGVVMVCDTDGNPVRKVPLVMKVEAAIPVQ